MGRKLAVVTMLAFLCSINNVHSGPGNKISDLSTKFRYALYILNDENAALVRNFLLISDNLVRSCCPVKFYRGRYYRVYLFNDEDEECGYLCDDVQMAARHSLPANTPLVTPANTPVADPGMNNDLQANLFFPPSLSLPSVVPDDRYALSIPPALCRPEEVAGQKLTPAALARLEILMSRLEHAESGYDLSGSIPQLEQEIAGETVPITREDADKALFFYLKKRAGMNESGIFFTHNRESESNIMMVIRRSFKVLPESPDGEERAEQYDCLEISIPVGSLEFASVQELLSMPNEYSGCSVPWQQHVREHGLPEGTGDSGYEPDMVEFSEIALLDCLEELERHWNPSNPIDNPMVERVLGTGISSVVVSLFNNFRSLAFKRIYMTTQTREGAMEVPRSARINLLLLSTYGVPVAPMRYEVVHNREKGHYAIYCIQTQYQPEQFADHFLESPQVPAEEKMKLINTIIHFMNLCDISNGYQLKVDDGFKGYFRVVVDCNYPNYCFINDAWQLIDLAPFFWSVGDHFSSANQQILDMSQSEDYYSFIKSLCTNPAQLYVFFCGRMYRPYQRYSRSTHPHDQKKAREWLGLYNYALRRVASLPQIAHEFDQPQWRALSAFDNKNQDDFWDLLVQQRNSDPSHEYLEGVIELVSQNNLAGRPIILDGAVKQWQQLPTEYSDFIGAMNYVDPVDYLSMTEEQRAGRRLSDIFDLADRFGMDTPEPILPSRADNSEEAAAAAAASRNQLMEFLRLQALMRTLSQNMAKDNNRRAAQRRRVLQEQRVSNPPPPPAIYTHLTAMNNAEMADYLNLRFNAEYIPVDDDGNCMWAAITRVLRRRGIVINPQDMMQAVLPPGQQEGVPAHQQNWGDTDFTAKILQYLAQLGHHFGIVVIQPYGAEMVAVWYGLENGQLTVLPLGNDPVEIQQAIQNPNNITLVNHQNGNDGEFQVNHWGGVVPIPPAGAGVAGIVMADAAAPEGPVVEYPTAITELEEPSSKRSRIPSQEYEEHGQTLPDSTTHLAVSPPLIFEQKFQSTTGLSLLRANGILPRPVPGTPQPLTHFRNLLLSLISNHLLMCHRDVTGCGHQLDGILSLLPEDQNITNQDLRTGNIAPFLHLLAALIRWMNPQPAHDVQVNIAPTQDTLTGITLICPVIGYRGVMAFAAWRLTLVSSTRNYLHVQRRFIRNLDMSSKGLQDRRHLYFVTNIPITPTGNLAWPFHNPVPAQWWLVVPLIHAIWMLGTKLEAHVEHGLDVHPDSSPKDFQRELSDEVSLLEIASPPPVRTGRLSLPLIIIEPPSPDEREEHPKDKKKEEDRGDDINWNPGRKHKFDETSFRHTHYKISQPMPPYPWKLPIPDALSIGSTLVPLLLFRKAGY